MNAIAPPESLLHQAARSAHDYAELTKLRVTTLIVLTTWCSYFFAARQAGMPAFSWGLLHALIGVGLVSSGTAALNEVIERDVDRQMRRTARRPVPAGRMRVIHASAAGVLLIVGGSAYLCIFTNPLTGFLTFLTSVVYLVGYTPLKRVSTWCTFVGAFPGAMPAVLGWTAAQERVGVRTLVLFAILFLWQFPHFFSIAWLYRDDYASGGIRMLPVVEADGRSTARRILLYSIALLPISLLPSFIRMTEATYLAGAVILDMGLIYFGYRLAVFSMAMGTGPSRLRARRLLQATVIYLPLLFALMMVTAKR